MRTGAAVKRKFRATTCRVHCCLMEAVRDGYCAYHDPAQELQRVDHLIHGAERKLVRLRERRKEVAKRL